MTDFLSKLKSHGIDPGGELAEGKLTRATCLCKPGKKGRDGNAWYLYHADEPASLTWGCWNDGCQNATGGKLFAKSEESLSPAEKEIIKTRVEADRKAREVERQQVEQATKTKAAGLWQSGHDVSADHDYIKRKGIRPIGIKQIKDMLLVPMSSTGTGEPESLQLIFTDGGKKFLTGTGAVPGPLYHVIPGRCKGGPLFIVEGWATGCSVHEATGASVVVAFSSGKLPAVAAVMRDRFPDREIVIAGDTGNGSNKAVEAALKIGGKVALPTMPEGTAGTDFNDLHQVAGSEEVKRQLLSAKQPEYEVGGGISGEQSRAEYTLESKNPLIAAVERLAALSPLEYDQVRVEEAKTLGVRPSSLDAAIKNHRKAQEQRNDTPFHEVEPADEPVDGEALLDDVLSTVKRFIVCGHHTAVAATLWIVSAWFTHVVRVAPLALITAPEKRCGKSTLLELIGRLTPKPLTASSITPSALFRAIDLWGPTLLIDEVDATLKDNEELRGLINSGHTRSSAYTIRCTGDDHKPTMFSTWGFKALSGIGHVSDTLMDRSILLELRRRLPDETVDRMHHAPEGYFQELCSRLARFTEDNAAEVKTAKPPLPDLLNDRARDNWEPLLQVAMTAGSRWLNNGIATAEHLAGVETESVTVGSELLADIQGIFAAKGVDRISTTDLITALIADEEKPWATYNRGFQIKPRQLAAKLKGYGIHSKTTRINNATHKGYELSQFKEVFSRYIPSTPLSKSNTVTSKQFQEVSSISKGNTDPSVTFSKQPNYTESLDCYLVTDRIPPTEDSEIFDLTNTDFEVVL